MTMRLSTKYETTFSNMIHGLAKSTIAPAAKLCAFWPMLGCQFSPTRGLLVIGRSVNGWDPAWAIDNIRDDNAIVMEARQVSEDPKAYCCPMEWVRDFEGKKPYNTRRAAFWRVVKRVAVDLHESSETDWFCNVAWSNFYKIAPAVRDTPSPKLQSAQVSACTTLLEAELDELKPRYVLVILGDENWYRSLVDHLQLTLTVPLQSETIEATAVSNMGQQRWVFAKRPDSRQRGNSDNRWVQQVVEAFK